MKFTRPCDYCQAPYQAEQRYLNRNQGKFCSRVCSAKYNAQSRYVEPEHNLICAYCNTTFYRQVSHHNSKSGLFFCSREHKDLAQRIGGIKEIQPPHYSDQVTNYRRKAKRLLDTSQCSKCGYSKYPEILQINHIDCNRKNNNIENLEVLCPTCHMEYHFTTRTGPWGSSKK